MDAAAAPRATPGLFYRPRHFLAGQPSWNNKEKNDSISRSAEHSRRFAARRLCFSGRRTARGFARGQAAGRDEAGGGGARRRVVSSGVQGGSTRPAPLVEGAHLQPVGGEGRSFYRSLVRGAFKRLH